MKTPYEGIECDVCHNEFTMWSWVNRHEENVGTDEWPDVRQFCEECCPSCAILDDALLIGVDLTPFGNIIDYRETQI